MSKMTRKRCVKLLMGSGVPRNDANYYAWYLSCKNKETRKRRKILSAEQLVSRLNKSQGF